MADRRNPAMIRPDVSSGPPPDGSSKTRDQSSSGAPSNLPYGRQSVDADDIGAVSQALAAPYLTTGPLVDEFEKAFARVVAARHGVAVSSGTAALHAAMAAIGIGPGDEVVLPPITFAATANAVVFQGGTPVFADVDPERLLVDPDRVEARITPRTRAIVAVDYAGHPCDYERLRRIADRHRVTLVADSCHALGASHKGRPAGSLADLTAFSFHPVKHITTGEGGMVTTDDDGLAARMRRFRNHGIDRDHQARTAENTHEYHMVDLGYNYRLSDFQCALGLSQLKKLPTWLARRRELARRYDAALARLPGVSPLPVGPDVEHAYHLYVVRLEGPDRDRVFAHMRKLGIGVNVHYVPVHLHPYYQKRLGSKQGDQPVAEEAYRHILTLPLFPRMTDGDVERVVGSLAEAMNGA